MYDECMMSVWWVCDKCMISVWWVYDACMMSIWWVYDECIISVWCVKFSISMENSGKRVRNFVFPDIESLFYNEILSSENLVEKCSFLSYLVSGKNIFEKYFWKIFENFLIIFQSCPIKQNIRHSLMNIYALVRWFFVLVSFVRKTSHWCIKTHFDQKCSQKKNA